jgi:hypothetical protein
MSAYKIETWLKKGYTIEEAKYQINIRRPTSIEYYENKFNVDRSTAIKMRDDRQEKYGQLSACRSKESHRKSSVRCVEYWKNKGFTHEQAQLKVSEIQNTFSIDKCKRKFGDEKGHEVWLARQKKWQETLSQKTTDEKNVINKKKNTKKLKNWVLKYGEKEGRDRFIQHLEHIRNKKVPLSLKELEIQILSEIAVDDTFIPPTLFAKKIPNYIWELIPRPKNVSSWLESFVEFKHIEGVVFKPQLRHGFYQMYAGTKLLRSKNEIYMYMLLTEAGLKEGLDFIIEKYYPVSTMRSDFYLVKGDQHVELAGFNDEKYLQKMKYKENTFNSKILYDKKYYKEFLEEYISSWYKK